MRRIEPKRLIATGYGERRAVVQHHVLEQQRLPAARLLHHAVGDLAQLEIRGDRLLDASTLTGGVECSDEFLERVEGHGM